MMYQFSAKFWARLSERIHGPGGFRFIIQPIIAIILGIRDGLQDARTGQPPYVVGVLFHPELRHELRQSALKSILKPIIFASLLDAVFQYFIFRTVHPVAAIIVGTFVMGVPYILARALTNRVMSHRNRRSASTDTAQETA